MNESFSARGALRTALLLVVTFGLALTPGVVRAQESDIEDSGGIHLGPLGVKPRIAWQTDYEDNVFRSAVAPVSDVVQTFSARTDLRGQVRRVGLSATGTADWVHYSTFESERGTNVGANFRVDFRFNRIVPYVGTTYENTRQRINPEIDSRPRITEGAFTAGSLIRIGGKTAIDVAARRTAIDYDETETYDGLYLSRVLNRASDSYSVSLVQEVTTLTSLTLTGEMRKDLFDTAYHRNADYMRATVGFASNGRIRGNARFGIRSHKPRDTNLSDSLGFYMSVGTNATLHDRVQLAVSATRDLVPSYRLDIPYYEATGVGTTLTYAMFRVIHLSGQVGLRFSDYRTSGGATDFIPQPEGTERENLYGSGVSYRLGDATAINFLATYIQRTSDFALRHFDYSRLRVGVSHGF